MHPHKIAICDLLMCWPPDAGAFVDVVNVASYLSRYAHVRLIVPEIDTFFKGHRSFVDKILSRHSRFFLRGHIEGEMPFEVTKIPFSGTEFKPSIISDRYKRVLDDFAPDKTFISNGWHLKVHLVRALKEYKPILRIYAHESLCTKADGWFFKRAKMCKNNYLSGDFTAYITCLFCTLSFYTRYPAVRWVQEYIQSGAYKRGYINLVKDAFCCASTIITYNNFTAQRVMPYNPNVVIIPSGVNTTHFYPSETNDATNRFCVLATGRVIERHKGRDFLIAVAREIYKTAPDILFYVTGIRTGFKEINIKEIGWFSQDKLPILYHQADVVFIPSLWPEPQGIVAVEAWASGLPVLASDVGGLRDMVKHGENGFLVKPFDVDTAVGYILELYHNRDLCQRLGNNGRKIALEFYNWENIFKKYYNPLFLEHLYEDY